ncbi:MAG: serine O-acetyltransferase [Clostridia bacterium]
MKDIKKDLLFALQKDPAARSKLEIYLTYGGFKALRKYRKAHWLYTHGMKMWAQLVSSHARKVTGVDIHPAAKIAGGVFIDHGVGVVIGETAEIGTNVVIYQGVTLGGTGKDVGKRHPTVGDNVMISAGAKVLGPITIGHDCKIGAGSVVLKNVPPFSTVVGVPGRIVKQNNVRVVDDLDQMKLPDPILEEIASLNCRIQRISKALNIECEEDSFLKQCRDENAAELKANKEKLKEQGELKENNEKTK